MSIESTIQSLIDKNRVILFMKGTPDAPECGFSRNAILQLRKVTDSFAYVNVLTQPRIREGLPKFSHFPTFPQLFVAGELIGGSDIVEQMVASGELAQLVSTGESGASEEGAA